MSEYVAFDLEGTLTAGVTWEGMRDYLVAYDEGHKFRRFFRRRLLSVGLYRLGLLRDERAFKERWILELLQLFTGYSQPRMTEVGAWVVERKLWPGRRLEVVDELERHQEEGRAVVIVSGLFNPFLALFAQKLRVEYLGTPLEFENGRFTGRPAAPLNVGDRKAERLREMLGDPSLYAAYGDTRRDIPLLKMAAQPVAVHPDAELRQAAQSHNWRILES